LVALEPYKQGYLVVISNGPLSLRPVVVAVITPPVIIAVAAVSPVGTVTTTTATTPTVLPVVVSARVTIRLVLVSPAITSVTVILTKDPTGERQNEHERKQRAKFFHLCAPSKC
jgi:hypothetical protein